MSAPRPFPPIADLAMIGDCHGAALVAGGSVEWCALGRFDADPILFPCLDRTHGGAWRIEVEGARVSRAYEEGTNVLRTLHEGPEGVLEVLDLMPVGRAPEAGAYDYVRLLAPNWAIRRMRVIEGRVDVRTQFRPAGADWGLETPALREVEGAYECGTGASFHCDLPLSLEGAEVRGTATLSAGETRHAVLCAQRPHVDPLSEAERLLAISRAFWTEWLGFCRYDGPHAALVRRSALALKMLTYAPTGALVAAATTSLPEELGGARNWDYRYCWVRDSALTLYALSAIGYSGEAEAFADFLESQPLPRVMPLQIMYGVHGERALPERELDHLEGYEGSAPVRTGNGAHDQLQIDTYGEMLDLAQVRVRLGARLGSRERMMLADAADEVARIWKSPDAGLWEARGAPQHYGHSKMMAWVALDRAIDVLGPRPRWTAARDAALDALEAAVRQAGHLTRVVPFGERTDVARFGQDAALLLAPAHGVPLGAEALDATVRDIEAQLRSGDLVHRYHGEDGLDGEEGAFLICSFWLVDALLATGRGEEAEGLFDRLCALASDVGLFAEEAEPGTGAHLGNTPQAFTHLALIGSAVNLALWRQGGAAAIEGCYADRAERVAGRTHGPRALFESLRQGGISGLRVRPSQASVMPPL